MSTLHFAFTLRGLAQCADRVSVDDQIILLGDAVYAQKGTEYAVLDEDAKARGIITDHSLGYDDLVQLTQQHEKVVSWP